MYPWGLQTSFFRGCLIRMTGHILDKFKLSLTAMVGTQTTAIFLQISFKQTPQLHRFRSLHPSRQY